MTEMMALLLCLSYIVIITSMLAITVLSILLVITVAKLVREKVKKSDE